MIRRKTRLKASKGIKRRPLKLNRTTRLIRGRGGLKRGRKRRTEADLKRGWFIKSTYSLRYKGLRGVYWYWLSRDVRKSEWEKYGVCLTCLKPIENWEQADCGHIIASRWCGEFLRFHRLNLTIQHKGCNNPRFCPQAGVLNAINIDKRHGVGHMERLLQMQKIPAKEPKQSEYHDLIHTLNSFKEARKLLM